MAAPLSVSDAAVRVESARLIAGIARIVRDVGVAEDLAQDALVAALEQWPKSGVPDTSAMYGPSPLVAKVIGIFVSMDRMVGKDFESGLANLKTAAGK